jgi:hypothetical protein
MEPKFAILPLGIKLDVVEEAIDMLNLAKTSKMTFKHFSIEIIKRLFSSNDMIISKLNAPHVNIDGVTCTISDTIFDSCEIIRDKLETEFAYDYLIAITPYSLYEHKEEATLAISSPNSGYFIVDDENKCSIISLQLLEEFAVKSKRTLSACLAALIIEALVGLLTPLDPEKVHLDIFGNPTSIGCLMDYCDKKDEVIISFINYEFCNGCTKKILQSEYGNSILEITRTCKKLPWTYNQPISFWFSVGIIPLGILMIIIGKTVDHPRLDVLSTIGTVSSIAGSLLFGISRIIKRD